MSVHEVVIEALHRRGKLHWQVRMGRRALTFHEEYAARTFAAQLHLRLTWLQQTQAQGSEFAPPEMSH